MRKTQFNFDEHVQLATDLDSIRTTLMMHIARLSESYPKSSRQITLVRTLQKTIDSLRCKMDDAFHYEYPGEHYRKPYFDWVNSPYFFPECEKRIIRQMPEQNDGDVKRCACAMGKKG